MALNQNGPMISPPGRNEYGSRLAQHLGGYATPQRQRRRGAHAQAGHSKQYLPPPVAAITMTTDPCVVSLLRSRYYVLFSFRFPGLFGKALSR